MMDLRIKEPKGCIGKDLNYFSVKVGEVTATSVVYVHMYVRIDR